MRIVPKTCDVLPNCNHMICDVAVCELININFVKFALVKDILNPVVMALNACRNKDNHK